MYGSPFRPQFRPKGASAEGYIFEADIKALERDLEAGTIEFE